MIRREEPFLAYAYGPIITQLQLASVSPPWFIAAKRIRSPSSESGHQGGRAEARSRSRAFTCRAAL
jgi:hypothetical protein